MWTTPAHANGRRCARRRGARRRALRARDRGLDDITPAQGDARELPYADGTFDAAFLTAVLGETPDRDAALREVARVLKPAAVSSSRAPARS
jgi:ubiquinone/menaquinone biosynthesis C-methylase UbiE